MFGFDKMFDMNRDGKLSPIERTMQAQFMEEMMKEEEKERRRNAWDDKDEENDDSW